MEHEPNLVAGQYDAFKHQMTMLERFHTAQQAVIADGANEELQEQANLAAKDLFIVSWFSGAGERGIDGPAADLAKDFIPSDELDEMLTDPNGLADRFAHLKAVATPKVPMKFDIQEYFIKEYEILPDHFSRIRDLGRTALENQGFETELQGFETELIEETEYKFVGRKFIQESGHPHTHL